MSARIIVGDCRDELRNLDAGSVQTCITSPPYFGLRDYGHDAQIGLEATPDEFVAAMVAVFREVRRVLADDGTLWLNLGDSYCAAPKGAGVSQREADRATWDGGFKVPSLARRAVSGQSTDRRVLPGVKQKDLLGIPWMVAFALRADGWYLRSDIIWAKPNPMPSSVTDRPTTAHEYLFLLSKSPRYYYDHAAIAEETVGRTLHDVTGPARVGVPGQTDHTGSRTSKRRSIRPGVDTNGGGQGSGEMSYDALRRNKRDVWTVPTRPFPGAHFATFPPDLIEPCVLAGAPEGGIVLDPFAGAGTTGMVALRHGRRFVGIELNPEYAELARRRIVDDAPLLNEVAA